MDIIILLLWIGSIVLFFKYRLEKQKRNEQKRKEAFADYERKRAAFYCEERQKIKAAFMTFVKADVRPLEVLLSELAFLLRANSGGGTEWKSDLDEMTNWVKNFCQERNRFRDYNTYREKSGGYYQNSHEKMYEKAEACYRLFGLTPATLTEETLKTAYRRLVKKYHPNVNKTAEGEEKFKEICNAYEFLKKEL